MRHAFLFDYEGLGWRHLNPSIFFRLRPIVASLNAYYPEFIGSATLINTPPLFVHLWAIVSPWLSPAVRKRVTTVEPGMTLVAVSKLVPPSSLPKLYGGTCEEVPSEVRHALGLDETTARLRGIYDDGGSAASEGRK